MVHMEPEEGSPMQLESEGRKLEQDSVLDCVNIIVLGSKEQRRRGISGPFADH